MEPNNQNEQYYLPGPSPWPITASIGVALTLWGAANWLHDKWYGPYLFFLGLCVIIFVVIGWFGTVIRENEAGLLKGKQLDYSFRLGMGWFIFSEVCLFGAFFGALFYSRLVTVPWLSGTYFGDGGTLTHLLLWPNFVGGWPVFQNPDPGKFAGPHSVMAPWGIPALNTFILLTSSVTVTIAHWALIKNQRTALKIWLAITILLGISFVFLQAHEYWEAYTIKGLTLESGIFGTTFFMLTGLHGLHVTLGTIMLIVMLGRCMKGHFTPENHFGFQAASWYWHFVDVVWLFLFVFVYWLV